MCVGNDNAYIEIRPGSVGIFIPGLSYGTEVHLLNLLSNSMEIFPIRRLLESKRPLIRLMASTGYERENGFY